MKKAGRYKEVLPSDWTYSNPEQDQAVDEQHHTQDDSTREWSSMASFDNSGGTHTREKRSARNIDTSARPTVGVSGFIPPPVPTLVERLCAPEVLPVPMLHNYPLNGSVGI